MPIRSRSLKDSETGGITILVALMLLVLLTVAAVGMSRNSLRQIVIASTVRQGAEVMNTADAGLEWTMFWMYRPNAISGAPTASATGLVDILNKLQTDPTLAGKPQFLGAPPAAPSTAPWTPWPAGSEVIYTNANGATRQFGLQLTQMGQVKPPGFSVQNVAFYPLAWSVRSDAQVSYPGGLTFQHSREMWATTPVGTITNQ